MNNYTERAKAILRTGGYPELEQRTKDDYFSSGVVYGFDVFDAIDDGRSPIDAVNNTFRMMDLSEPEIGSQLLRGFTAGASARLQVRDVYADPRSNT